MKTTLPFVALGLEVCKKLEVQDTESQRLIIHFCKIYTPEKIKKILDRAMSYFWWRNNPKVSFMKAIGEINREEKK